MHVSKRNYTCMHDYQVRTSFKLYQHFSASGQRFESVRLVVRNGQISSTLIAGCLEVYYNGQWGTVCADYFGTSEARTACGQLVSTGNGSALYPGDPCIL